jgi:hypothetical protein
MSVRLRLFGTWGGSILKLRLVDPEHALGVSARATSRTERNQQKGRKSLTVAGFCRTIKLESTDYVPIVSFGIVAQLTNRIPRR